MTPGVFLVSDTGTHVGLHFKMDRLSGSKVIYSNFVGYSSLANFVTLTKESNTKVSPLPSVLSPTTPCERVYKMIFRDNKGAQYSQTQICIIS